MRVDNNSSEILAAITVMKPRLPKAEQRQVEIALARIQAQTVGAMEWDLQAANTLEAVYRAVAERVEELGGKAVKVTGIVIEDVVKPVAASVSITALSLAALVLAVWLYNRDKKRGE